MSTGVFNRDGLRITRVFSSPDTHPYNEIVWEKTDIVMKNWRDGTVNFEQRGVEFPDFWSMQARQIVANKYFRGKMGTENREWSLRQLLDRVVDTYTSQGSSFGYFAADEDAKVFSEELKWLLLHQYFSFNSPVWFNIGCENTPQQVSACFLLSVDDDLSSILEWYREEGFIFKGGSGSGVNLSRIRSSKELMSSGGVASGPVSFMRGADASAGAIKSGGSTRRAAKLVCLDVDHPDILEFVKLKSEEEKKIRVLRDAGFDMDLGGADIHSVQYQNANNSVRVSDAFMRAVKAGERYPLRARVTGEIVDTVDACGLFHEMAQSAWECADPGIQYDDTINSWNTCPESGRITTSNPCSEYMHLDNSSCNLASLNLLKFLTPEGNFNTAKFIFATQLIITAMDISVSFADFPTKKITEVSGAFRQLGLGYANLGALLMALGKAYDSPGGRALAASITSLMSAAAWRQSVELASRVGSYEGYDRNSKPHQEVVRRHWNASTTVIRVDTIDKTIFDVANVVWEDVVSVGNVYGYRNAQISLIAPTGTISFMMDCTTTGIEPEFSLVKQKKLSDGGSMKIVNQIVPMALRSLGYTLEQIEAIVEFVLQHGHVIDAPALKLEHYEVFDCAVGARFISARGHVGMMSAVQPYLSGAISKTINMPADSTVEDIKHVYMEGWKLGLKSLAVYRDGSKASQPLSTMTVTPELVVPVRHRLPSRRHSETTSFGVGGAEGYLTVGLYPENTPGEIFLKLGKQGSTLAGLLDAFSVVVSIAMQYGVPLDVLVEKFVGMQFEPRGMTTDSEIRLATSLMDYVFRRLALDYLPLETRESLGILSVTERVGGELSSAIESASDAVVLTEKYRMDAPLCSSCGISMRAAGVCYVCSNCGSTSGCS